MIFEQIIFEKLKFDWGISELHKFGREKKILLLTLKIIDVRSGINELRSSVGEKVAGCRQQAGGLQAVGGRLHWAGRTLSVFISH